MNTGIWDGGKSSYLLLIIFGGIGEMAYAKDNTQRRKDYPIHIIDHFCNRYFQTDWTANTPLLVLHDKNSESKTKQKMTNKMGRRESQQIKKKKGPGQCLLDLLDGRVGFTGFISDPRGPSC